MCVCILIQSLHKRFSFSLTSCHNKIKKSVYSTIYPELEGE